MKASSWSGWVINQLGNQAIIKIIIGCSLDNMYLTSQLIILQTVLVPFQVAIGFHSFIPMRKCIGTFFGFIYFTLFLNGSAAKMQIVLKKVCITVSHNGHVT